MLPILPFNVPIASAIKPEGLKARRDGQFSKPLDYWNVDAVRGGITDDETNLARPVTNFAKGKPDVRQIQEVTGDHQVVCLLAAL
jgi:hypothetical protein